MGNSIGFVLLLTALLVVFVWSTASWLPHLVIAIIAFSLGHLSNRLPIFTAKSNPEKEPTIVSEADAAVTSGFVESEKASVDTLPAAIENMLAEETDELGFSLPDEKEIEERIQRQVKERSSGYDPRAALAARREKIMRRNS